MTLIEMAELVCEKVGQTDEASMALCKRFLRARNAMLWDAAAWRESLLLGSAETRAGEPCLLLPEGMERALAVRKGDAELLRAWEVGTLLRVDASRVDAPGETIGFGAAPQACFFWPHAEAPYLAAGLAEDAGKRTTLLVEALEGNVHRISAETAALPTQLAPLPFAHPHGFWVLAWSREPMLGTLNLNYSFSNLTREQSLAVGQREFPRRGRVRLFSPPAGEERLLVLGKRRAPELLEDSDAPELPNASNALLAYAMSDMLERQRQYAKAQLKLQEAQAHFAGLVDLERNQTATEWRIIPEVLEPAGVSW